MTGSSATRAVRRTKLICTLGPATVHRIPELFESGMDVARINSSHGTSASRAETAAAVRSAAAAFGTPGTVMTDLSGPKIRMGELSVAEIELEAGRRFVLRPNAPNVAPGDVHGVAVSYDGLARDVRPGDRILVADGAVELRVIAADADVVTEVVRGGTIRSRAGIAIPADRLSAPAIGVKDREDLRAAIAFGTDLVAQSFVRGPADVLALRELIGPDGPPIVAKIETRPAVLSFDAILDVVDAVMIARGDLGVEMPFEDVPVIQKQLVRRALDRGVPSIVATQMLESMTHAARPTRAEASDVANAVFDGADAIMLSGETAIGEHPVLAARAAAAIAAACESSGGAFLAPGTGRVPSSDVEALAVAAVELAAATPDVAAIACYTRTGATARVLSARRPRVPIVAFSPDPAVVRRLGVVHGVVSRQVAALQQSIDRVARLAELVAGTGILPPGSAVVCVASTSRPGSAPNVLSIDRLPVSGSAG
ncbi:MAG TPA: pyruvate kinase [Candidatus Limnocylindrales bacterium]|nr:pyruvate kinase [Candidatus Limnocylindrales bacterium]